METVPIWLFVVPPLGFVFGIFLIYFRKPLQRHVVSIERRIGLPKWMRQDAMSQKGGAVLIIGIGFLVISVLQAIILLTQI